MRHPKLFTEDSIKQEFFRFYNNPIHNHNPMEVERNIRRTPHLFFTLDPETINTLNQLVLLSMMDTSILIQGPSGIGKEILAKLLHSEGPLVNVNCGAIPENLFEAEFFGAKRGSYTGCHKDREGYFSKANRGLLFLDEIGELPQIMQAKLLRALEQKTATPLGGDEYTFNTRIIAATNKPLWTLVKQGSFREDLYFRIAKMSYKIKPLSERPKDCEYLYCFYYKKLWNNKPSEESQDRFSEWFAEYKEDTIARGNCRAIISYVIQELVNGTLKLVQMQ